jgi:predicted dehydrogenase
MQLFLKLCLLSIITVSVSCVNTKQYEVKMIELKEPKRPAGQENVLQLAVAPIPTVRIGFIGVGNRGGAALRRYIHMEGVDIKAICDLKEDLVKRGQSYLQNKSLPPATEYVGEDTWKEVCKRDDIDLVYICTDWLTHTPMAVYAMEQGKHVAIEVPAAVTIEECWQLVDMAEKTRQHCTILENCCYDFFELTTLNMVQQGVLGELVHSEGAYIHDLRSQLENVEGWRVKFYENYTGNPYPTHGFGPICQAMNIHRGDKMNFLVSVSSDQFGMSAYLKELYEDGSPESRISYTLGDMNTTIIRTEKGKTIMIQHDVTSPRPYSRLYTLSGTKGFIQKYPTPYVALEPDAHQSLSEEKFKALTKEYEHPFIKEIGEKAKKIGGHGGMDFIMDYRLIHCLRNGLPLDMDVYDAAEWSCLVELTKISITNGGQPVKIPDFTRGDWNELQGLKFF